MAELSTGTIVDERYKILSRLGAGGMADVFLAEDQQLGRKIALKLLHRRFAEDPDFVERFRREAQAAAGLQHPNVVSVYDRGSYDGTYYIAMEYLPGRSLKQLIRQEAPLDSVRAIDLTIQILRAARFAHRRGVIHRDLKPHNVIVDDADHAKVTDFGIARAGASDMTETGSIMGTSQYLSPEQAQGLAVAATSDLYSVGIVLYELLTGRVPFDAESAVTIALKHVSEAPPPPSRLNPEIPPELEQVVLWSLNKSPEDRPTDADQFITVLEQVKEAIVTRDRGQQTASMAALSAIPPSVVATPPPRDTGELRRVYGIDALAPLPLSADPIPPEGPAERERRLWPWLLALLILLLAGGAVAAYLLTRPAKDTVPTVVGRSLGIAQTEVQNAGFNVSVQSQQDPHRSGTVIRQFPLGDSRAEAGSTVALTVSTGPGNVNVPTVSGLAEAAARKRLRSAGLKVDGIQMRSSGTVPAGHAIATDPSSGASVGSGSFVTLVISSGKAPLLVPDVTGDTEPAARNTLTNAGFTVTPSKQQSSTVAPGTVISQSPSASSQAAAGTAVSIVIATAPTTAKVPNVVGDTAAAAAGALTSAGFQVTKHTKATSKQNQAGNVIAQSPKGGNLPKGSTVTIVVGVFTPGGTKTTPTPTTTTTTPTTPTTTTTTPGG